MPADAGAIGLLRIATSSPASVIPAKAGIQWRTKYVTIGLDWIPDQAPE